MTNEEQEKIPSWQSLTIEHRKKIFAAIFGAFTQGEKRKTVKIREILEERRGFLAAWENGLISFYPWNKQKFLVYVFGKRFSPRREDWNKWPANETLSLEIVGQTSEKVELIKEKERVIAFFGSLLLDSKSIKIDKEELDFIGLPPQICKIIFGNENVTKLKILDLRLTKNSN